MSFDNNKQITAGHAVDPDKDYYPDVTKISNRLAWRWTIHRKSGPTRALDSNDHIIYDRASGALWYDPDGSGSQAQIQFALIDNNASLTNLDFLVI